MEWWKDPAWYSLFAAILALIFSVPSAVLSWKSLKWERDSADSARRSAEAAEQANLFTERALALNAGVDPGEVRALAPASRGDVSWQIEHRGGSQYVLRNTGTDIAEHVSVDAEQLGGLARSVPADAVIRPQQGVDFLILATWGHPAPNQLYIKWNDMQEYVAVPMPA
ncbi:hypothetical protein [Mycolicibacterium hodleri]|uniref:Uncharacterized protein n=1 Tax=Mycolicibacterium hodleri TaxID=49897 RepID=A0A502E5G0_9MYCO|nr:hypothetical protein [Mycolicibacterium hodleri]TPG31660.1 hypothetical protein EAH80_22155 [Mycolicibacterium hodleri]